MIPRYLMERNEQFDLELLSNYHDAYSCFKGMWVNVILPHVTAKGVYIGTTNKGKLVLNPHVAYEDTFLPNQMPRPFVSDNPFFVTGEHVAGVLPLDESKLEFAIQGTYPNSDNLDSAC